MGKGQIMKNKQRIRAILILVLVVAVMIAAVFILQSFIDPDNDIMGNNVNAGVYTESRKEILYASMEEGLAAQVENYESLTMLYQATTQNVAKAYLLDQNQVEGYEFLIRDDGQYQYMGERTLIFAGVLDEEKYDWETTLRADLSYSLAKSYLKIVAPGELYEVLPAWGVSTSPLVQDVQIDGKAIDEVISFTQDDSEYYLWIVDDLSCEHGANSVEITY